MRSGRLKNLLLLLTIFFAALTVARSFHYSAISGGSDLRNRIVGSRLMARGYSPYFYKWNPTDGQRLLDPNDRPERITNGNTLTPAVLLLMRPLAVLNYPAARTIWTILQLAAAMLLCWLMLRRHSGNSPILPVFLIVAGMFCSDYWFMHIERGQIYIFHALLFGLMYYSFTASRQYGHFVSGFIGGIFIFLRPFAGIVGLGFLIKKQWSWVKGCLSGAIFGALVFVAPCVPVWRDYFRAMAEYGKECLHQWHFIPGIHHSIPAVIEGAGNLGVIQQFRVAIAPAVYKPLIWLGIGYSAIASYLLCGFFLAALSIFFLKKKTRSTSVTFFLFAYLAYMIPTFLMLNPRSPYSLIEWGFPLFLMMQELEGSRSLLIVLIISLLLLFHNPFDSNIKTAFAEIFLLMLTTWLVFRRKGTMASCPVDLPLL